MPASTNSEQIAPPSRSSKATLLKQIRQLHMYLGVFFAPAILFFAITGALQMFGLHKGHPGEAYQPPKWLAAVSSIHKDQDLSQHHGPPPGIADQPGAPAAPGMTRLPAGPRELRGGEEHHESKPTLVLKWFFLAMSIGLIATTLLGIYMAFKYNRSLVMVWSLLIAGIAIPAALIALLA